MKNDPSDIRKTSNDRQTIIDRERISRAVAFFHGHFKDQPTLEIVARHVNLSPWHFQRMFRKLTGITPKQFLHYITLWHAKKMLCEMDKSLTDIAFEMGLSGSSRLYDLFVKNEGMTPGEYKNRGAGLVIRYSFAPITSGFFLMASTNRGLCHLSFAGCNGESSLKGLKARLTDACFRSMTDQYQQEALSIVVKAYDWINETSFFAEQGFLSIKVWQVLLQSYCSSVPEKIEFGSMEEPKGNFNRDHVLQWMLPEAFCTEKVV